MPTEPTFEGSRLTVIGEAERSSRHAMWLCRCDCGVVKPFRAAHVKSGAARSCGCLRIEVTKARSHIHGMSKTRTYAIWLNMIDRCHNPFVGNYPRYGARGIKVCDRWRKSFKAFLNDMGPRPTRNHSIERLENNGNYEPSNCKWATATEQNRNKRNNRMITLNRVTLPMSEWGEMLGISPKTISTRLCRGWSARRALTTPGKSPS